MRHSLLPSLLHNGAFRLRRVSRQLELRLRVPRYFGSTSATFYLPPYKMKPDPLAPPDTVRSYRDKDCHPEIIEKWHATKEVLPEGWSSDWAAWFNCFDFRHYKGYRPTNAERKLNIMHKIWGPVIPLAYFNDCASISEKRYLFFAAGKYYVYYQEKDDLYRWDGPETFASHDDFLRWYRKLDGGFPQDGVTHMPQVGVLDQEDVYGGYGNTLPPLVESSARVVNPPRRYMGRASARELSETWHRPKTLPASWSCDWQNWPGIRLFFVATSWYSLSDLDSILKVHYTISGTVEPLAFFPHDDFTLLFAAAGDYYYIEAE
ncbi:hypothetical protein B0H19DRAFT_1380922 [Mycena capillaripes]|nr:hypothetical protein B0H19DRAFT_1380922 [Mycena capillaripes]